MLSRAAGSRLGYCAARHSYACSEDPHAKTRGSVYAVCLERPPQARLKIRCMSSKKVQGEAAKSLDCFTTSDGRLLCRRTTGDSHYRMSRLEDGAAGHGGMIKDWFLEGESSNNFCSVLEDGTLVCEILQPGHYVISKIEGAEQEEYEVEVEVGEGGRLKYNVIPKGTAS